MSGKTILIIDDSYTSLLLMDCTLKGEGYETCLASNVTEAIELLTINHPDLIILDLNMPEISGYDFLRMRNELKADSIPVIVVSALNSQESIQKSKELGAIDFISKPVNLELVINKIKSLIR